VGSVRIEIGHGHGKTVPGQPQGDSFTYSLSCTGNKRYVGFHHHILSG